MSEYIELKYAPHKCKKFCLGECVLDMKPCNFTFDECNKPEKELKEDKPLKFKSEYQKFKYENNYRKAEKNSDIRCKNCIHCEYHRTRNQKFYKCELLGFSFCAATDIRLSNVCNLFEREVNNG